MKPDTINFSNEFIFQTARSGGSGGQHVNKVETMVILKWHPASSQLLSDTDKEYLLQKVSGQLTSEGYLQVKAQEERSQLGNRLLAAKKMQLWIEKLLIRPLQRKATKATKASRLRRLESKKILGAKKTERKKWRPS